MASVVSTAPWLAVISAHKAAMFTVSGIMLAANYWLVIVRPRRCAPGELCYPGSPQMRFNRATFWISVGVFVVALAFTYGALLILDLS